MSVFCLQVCVKLGVFSLLPRMRFGFFYNMPMVANCYGSEVIRAFSQHVLYRLNIKQDKPEVSMYWYMRPMTMKHADHSGDGRGERL